MGWLNWWMLIEEWREKRAAHQARSSKFNKSIQEIKIILISLIDFELLDCLLGPPKQRTNQNNLSFLILKEKRWLNWLIAAAAVILFIFIKIIHNWFHQQVNSINYFIFISYSKYYPYCYNTILIFSSTKSKLKVFWIHEMKTKLLSLFDWLGNSLHLFH